MFCDVPGTSDPEATMTVAALDVAEYHGTGTYSFVGSGASSFDMTVGNTLLDAAGANGTVPATSCTVTLSGPATLGAGSEVQGHFHCDNVAGLPVVGSGGSTYVAVDGDFDGFGA